LSGNTVNEKPYYYIEGQVGGTVPTDAGQIQLYSCTDVAVKDLVIDRASYNIYVSYSNNITIYNNTCMNSRQSGILVIVSNDCEVYNNTCFSNDEHGIELDGWPGTNHVYNNTCNENVRSGIYLRHSLHSEVNNNLCVENDDAGIYTKYGDYINIHHNNATGNGWPGFYIEESDSVNIHHNTFKDNDGVYIYGSVENTVVFNNMTDVGYGVSLGSGSHYNTVANNSIVDCAFDGVEINGGSHNWIANNTCLRCGFGIHIYGTSTDNHIYWNILDDSITANAQDEYTGGDSNQIHNNYYHDYAGVDGNSDGIGDAPHPIPGAAANADPYPFMNPYVYPIPSTWSPQVIDQVVEYGDSFSYDINYTGPPSLYYWYNDTVHFSMDASFLITNATSLGVADYGFSMYSRNRWGHYLKAVFTITVEDTTAPEWVEEATDQTMVWYSQMNYSLTATDLSGIDHYWVNDTENFLHDSMVGFTNRRTLEPGVYGLEVRAYDPHDNYVSAEFSLTVTDPDPPELYCTTGGSETIYPGESHYIEWYVWDPNPDMFYFYIDGVLEDSGPWTGELNSYNYTITGLPLGVYNYTFVITDLGGNSASNTVIITVQEETTEPTETATTTTTSPTSPPPGGFEMDPMVVVALLGGGVAVVIILVIVLKRR
jgi:parallel beta-helix repeat protein